MHGFSRGVKNATKQVNRFGNMLINKVFNVSYLTDSLRFSHAIIYPVVVNNVNNNAKSVTTEWKNKIDIGTR